MGWLLCLSIEFARSGLLGGSGSLGQVARMKVWLSWVSRKLEQPGRVARLMSGAVLGS